MTFEDVKAGKLSTRVETADQFVDEIVATAKARRHGTRQARRRRAREVGPRRPRTSSDGTLLFYKFMTAAGSALPTTIGGFKVPTDDKRPLETPRGFKDPAKAMAMLDTVAGDVEKEYGTLSVKWGDVLRFRRGNADVPGNGAPSPLGAIRTIGVSPFKDGKVEATSPFTLYHIVWTPKYRKAVLVGEIAQAVQDLFAQIAEAYDMEIDTMEVMEDHVHRRTATVRTRPDSPNPQKHLRPRTLCAFPAIASPALGRSALGRRLFCAVRRGCCQAEIIGRYIRYQKLPRTSN